MSVVLLVDHDSFEYDIPPVSVFGPFDTVEEAQRFAEDFREENNLPREATAENNEIWTGAGWMFAIVEPQKEVARWRLP